MQIRENDLFVWIESGAATDEPLYLATVDRTTRDLRAFFAGRGCGEPDDLIGEVFRRLTEKLEAGQPFCSESGDDRKKFVYGVARNVLREWRRESEREVDLEAIEGREPSVPPVNLAGKECLQLLQEVFRTSLAQMNPAEQELLQQRDLAPGYSPRLAPLAKDRTAMGVAKRKRLQRARERFRSVLLAAEDRLADLRRCFGLALRKP